MVRDELDDEDSASNANMLQNKQLITNNVFNKRKEQLHRWESSEMNGEPVSRRKSPRVQFQDSDIFLSACMSGDEDEVEQLLAKGADINTSTVDGLTALHQSVIDSKLEMVRFLCERGAEVNAQDNEGWTPLHAAACCANLAIVKYLSQHGADLSIINSDKELAVDLADDEACREVLEEDYRRQGIDPEQCRDQELVVMMKDAKTWLNDGEYRDRPHPRTGASALHVAAAKGYTQLLELLIKAGGNVRSHDKDGWTPLHAAAHWAERDSCKILMEHGATVHDVNLAGQNVLAVADKEVVEYLEELQQAVDKRISPPSIPPASVLQDKNWRVSHDEHTITTDHKRDLQHRDQLGENETLHITSAKIPRLSEKSPSIDSQSSQSSVASTASVVSQRSEDERMPSVEKKTDSETSSMMRSSEERSSLVDESSSGSSKEMSIDSQSQRSIASDATSQQHSNGDGSSSCSMQSGDQTVTVTMPRPLQQANSWINRGVPLITRSTSSSVASQRPSADSSTSSLQSVPPQTATTSNFLPVVASSPSVTPTAPLNKPQVLLSSTVQRSISTPSNLPWASLCRNPSDSSRSPLLGPQMPHVLSQNRVSAFKPPIKTSLSPTPEKSELPRGLQPQHLNPIKMRPWQSSAVESEAERRNTARMQRQHRRSTQGVTKEQLEEASRLASEDTWRRRGSGTGSYGASSNTVSTVSSVSSVHSHREPVMARLASEERDSSMGAERSSASTERSTSERPSAAAARIQSAGGKFSDREDRNSSDSRCSPTNNAAATLSLPSPTQTPSAAGLRRKSQGLSLSRSNRRGTGPVLAEDIHAAAAVTTSRPSTTDSVSSRPLLSDVAPPPPLRFAPGMATTRPLLSTNGIVIRNSQSSTTISDRSDKSSSAPPSGVPSGATVTAASVRNAVVNAAASAANRVQARVAGQPVQGSISSYIPSTQQSSYPQRPTETNLNYKALYEKEKTENERLRRDVEDLKRVNDTNSISAFRTASSRFRNGSTPSTTNSTLPISKSASGASLDENERRILERKIAEMEQQLKGIAQLRIENQRLKEENGALVRVISKMTI